jgi:hypothetical protein
MKPRRRVGLFVGGACLATAVLVLAWPSGSKELGPVSQEIRRIAQMDALMASARRKQALKAEVINDLIAGRLTLAGAVDRCEEIEKEFPELAEEFRAGLEFSYPGGSFRERMARSIVAHCERRLENQPESAGPVLARLRDELAAFVRAA